jgi:uncharacterized protein (TIGR03663 family)
MSRAVIPGLVLALAVALALRCPDLGLRPMHNDEAVNAIKFRSLQEHGAYAYDPSEHHGPTLAYFTLLWTKLTGAPDFEHLDEARLRMVAVLFGVGLILLLPLIADGLGRPATLCAAALTAISPAMVFYSRYYIHEMLLVFFTFLALAAGWRYTRSGRLGWALLTGAAVGLMQCTKETFVFNLIAVILAGLATAWSGDAYRPGPLLPVGRVPPPGEPSASQSAPEIHRPKFRPLLAAAAVWLIVVITFFTSFFTHASGPLDALKTYLPWFQRAAGNSPHIHPWYFYFHRLAFFHAAGGPIWSEGLILALAVVGFIAAWRTSPPPDSHPGLLRFLAVYTAALTLIYCAVPYKTPWCLLEFWHPMILLAGVGALAVVRWMPRPQLRAVAALVLAAAAIQLAAQARRASVTWCADPRNPYVYAQTSPDLLELVHELEGIAASQSQGRHLLVKVICPGSDYWPLPWYLRSFDHVGWWDKLPSDPFAPVMIVSSSLHAGLDADKSHIMTRIYQLRPDSFLELYVQSNLWRTYLATKPASGDDAP